MNQGIKGIELFLAGWILALAAYYLGGLDTGVWVPLVVTGVEIVGLILIIAGIGKLTSLHKYFMAAGTVAAFALIASLGIEGIQALSLEGIADWMAIAAISLALIGDILFLGLTGLMFVGLSRVIRQVGNEKAANRLGYLWAVFLTFATLYLLSQAVSILLINQGLAALTYAVPATGFPMLIVGFVLVAQVYRIRPFQNQEQN